MIAALVAHMISAGCGAEEPAPFYQPQNSSDQDGGADSDASADGGSSVSSGRGGRGGVVSTPPMSGPRGSGATADCELFDPEGIQLAGDIALYGQSNARTTMVRMDRLDAPCFSMRRSYGPIVRRDGRLVYLDRGGQLRLYKPDDPADDDADPGANDEELENPCGTPEAGGFLFDPNRDEPVVSCGNGTFMQMVDGEPVEVGVGLERPLRAISATGLLWTTDSQPNVEDTIHRANGDRVLPTTDLTSIRAVAVRAHGNGFRFVRWSSDREYVRYSFDEDGLVTEEGVYGASPAGITSSARTYGVLDAEGNLYVRGEIGETLSLVKYEIGSSTILLDENDFTPYEIVENPAGTFHGWFPVTGS